jgi:hypothetical protein
MTSGSKTRLANPTLDRYVKRIRLGHRGMQQAVLAMDNQCCTAHAHPDTRCKCCDLTTQLDGKQLEVKSDVQRKHHSEPPTDLSCKSVCDSCCRCGLVLLCTLTTWQRPTSQHGCSGS